MTATIFSRPLSTCFGEPPPRSGSLTQFSSVIIFVVYFIVGILFFLLGGGQICLFCPQPSYTCPSTRFTALGSSIPYTTKDYISLAHVVSECHNPPLLALVCTPRAPNLTFSTFLCKIRCLFHWELPACAPFSMDEGEEILTDCLNTVDFSAHPSVVGSSFNEKNHL